MRGDKIVKNRKIPPTLTKGVAKVPVIMQLEALECGAASLAMVMAYYGKWIPLEQVRKDCGVSRDGSKASNMYKAAEHYGFKVRAVRATSDALMTQGQFPCIIHWNMCHFVVLKGFRGKKVYLNDPAGGSVVVSREEFEKSFSGICLMPVPSDEFSPSGRKKSTLEFARKRLVGAGPAVAFVMITTMLLYLFGIADSVTSNIFMDRLLTGINANWLYPFILFMILIAVLHLAVAWANTIYSYKISGKMAAIGSTSYMWRVLRLPIEFFSQRYAGDIQARLPLNASVAQTLVDSFAPLLLNSVMMIFYLVLMLRQSPYLTLVGIASLSVNIFLARIISNKRMNIARVSMRDSAKLEAASISGIGMIETIKASGAENGFFQKWAGLQASVNSQSVKSFRTDAILGTIPGFISSVANYVILFYGIYLTMEHQFTLGAVLMFQGFLSSFMQPAATLIKTGQTIQEMRTQMERVEDVMEYPSDPALDEAAHEDEKLSKLDGQVELKDITFGYSTLEKPLLSDFSLSVAPGERIAIVGASGSGKSTLSKLISGLYQPWSGQIFFDGRPVSEYPRDVITTSLAVVDQDIILFEDTVENNIRMWDESIDAVDVIMAARDAQLHDDIIQMHGGYKHRLAFGGRDLSGGQRQRMEIARVLAQDPTIIILDEATSALDAQTECDVVNAIKDRGITCIVIAHRLSTVRDCDRIIVLDNGSIAECGTHEELMKNNGIYAELVSSE